MFELVLAGVPALFLAMLVVANWRVGVLLCLPIGFLQDPIRKMIPGEPVFMVAVVVMYMALAGVVAISQRGGLRLNEVFGQRAALVITINLFIMLVFLQAMMAVLRYGSPIIGIIGLIAYLSPFPALWLAYHFPRQERDIETFLIRYVVLSALISFTIILSAAGVESSLFRQVGEGLVIFDRFQGIILEAHSGLMRSPEVAAWHMGTAACFVILLGVVVQRRWMIITGGPLALMLVGTGLLTGRRKILAEVVAFLLVYGALLLYFRQRSGRRAISISLGLGVSFVLISVVVFPQRTLMTLSPYLHRGGTVFGDLYSRFEIMFIDASYWAVYRAGFFGLGAGTGSQGTQHFTSEMIAGGVAEGGVGKILVELGVPGLILIVLLLWQLSRYLWRIMVEAQRTDPTMARLVFGLVAFLLANLPIFMGASQIYGDPLVLLVLGWCMGFILAAPRLIQQRAAWLAQQRASVSSAPSPVRVGGLLARGGG